MARGEFIPQIHRLIAKLRQQRLLVGIVNADLQIHRRRNALAECFQMHHLASLNIHREPVLFSGFCELPADFAGDLNLLGELRGVVVTLI